jgi:hypothetical protein
LFTIPKKLFVEQELLTLPEHLNSPPVFSGVRVTRSLVLYAVFCRLLFVLFLLAIVLSVLPFTDSDYYIGIKLFFFVYILLLFIFFFFALLFQLQYSFKVILPGIWHIYNTKDILTWIPKFSILRNQKLLSKHHLISNKFWVIIE